MKESSRGSGRGRGSAGEGRLAYRTRPPQLWHTGSPFGHHLGHISGLGSLSFSRHPTPPLFPPSGRHPLPLADSYTQAGVGEQLGGKHLLAAIVSPYLGGWEGPLLELSSLVITSLPENRGKLKTPLGLGEGFSASHSHWAGEQEEGCHSPSLATPLICSLAPWSLARPRG